MKFLKKLAIASALSSITLVASAMTPIADSELSMVSGQDGVSIAANLNVNIGSFVYGTANGTEGGGNVAFNNISITGVMAATLDILSADKFYLAGTGLATGTGAGEATTVLGMVTPVGAAPAAVAAAGAILAAGGPAPAAGTPIAAAYAVLAASGTTTAAGQAAAANYGASLQAFWPGTDVVRIAVPTLQTSKLLNISVASITMGTNGTQNSTNPSFGSFALNNINLAGTTAYIWAH